MCVLPFSGMAASQTLVHLSRHMSTASKQLTPKTKALLGRVLRVDHAGEFGAVRIYEGQLAVLGRSNVGPVIEVCVLVEQ